MIGGNAMEIAKINFKEKFNLLPRGDYSVRIIAKMNDYEFKIVRFRGEFVWHSHPDTDETFIILDGTLNMHFRDRRIEIKRGEMIVVPKGTEHKPESKEGYEALLIEPEGVPKTGDVDSDITIDKTEWV
jgi:mannose-6-phosphate isomerase-like protein (cupin superfamily)